MKIEFTIEDTYKVKAVACILLLFHHAFGRNYTHLFQTMLVTETFMILLVTLAKVCVFLFLIVSGYGLYLQYVSKRDGTLKFACGFVVKHIIKLYLQYWFIFLLFFPLGGAYEGDFKYLLCDFFAVSYILHTPMANSSWWYMSIILIFYLIFPMIEYVINKLSDRLNIILFLLMAGVAYFYKGSNLWFLYLVPFWLGILLAKAEFFSWYNNRFTKVKMPCILLGLIYLIIRTVWISPRNLYFVFDWILALLMIIFIKDVEIKGIVKRLAIFIGKHSGNIFMFHMFLIANYECIYWSKYVATILAMLTICCLLVSVIIEKLKKILWYDKLSEKILHKF